MTTPLPTGTLTFQFTDIEGSTSRWEHHRDAMSAALVRHDAVMRLAIEAHGGHEPPREWGGPARTFPPRRTGL